MTTVSVPPATRSPGLSAKATLVVSGFMIMLGGAAIAPALPDIKTAFADIPYAATLTGLVLSTHALAILLFSPVAGWIADRFGRKPALLSGLALFTVAGTSGFYLTNLPLILAGRFVLGLGIGLIMTASSALIGDLWSGDERRRLISYQQAATTGMGMLLILGGGALATVDWRAAFLIYGLGALIVPAVLAFVPVPERPGPGDRDTGRAAAEPTARLGTWLLPPIAAMFLAQTLGYIIPTQIPGLLQNDFGASPFTASAYLMVMSLVMAPAALSYPRLKRLASSAVLAGAAFLLDAAGFVAIAATSSLPMLLVGLVLYGGGMGFIGPIVSDWVVSIAAESVRGRATGMLSSALFLGQFLSPIISQPIINALGLYGAFGVLALGMAAAAAAFVGMGRFVHTVSR